MLLNIVADISSQLLVGSGIGHKSQQGGPDVKRIVLGELGGENSFVAVGCQEVLHLGRETGFLAHHDLLGVEGRSGHGSKGLHKALA